MCPCFLSGCQDVKVPLATGLRSHVKAFLFYGIASASVSLRKTPTAIFSTSTHLSAGGRDGTEVKPYVAPTREEQIKALKEDVFDVLVIGGGCVGSGGELVLGFVFDRKKGRADRLSWRFFLLLFFCSCLYT